MSHPIVLSSDAAQDIDKAFEYYNSRSYGLGFEFIDTLDAYFKKISSLPTASAIRFDNVRVKPIDTFPYNKCLPDDLLQHVPRSTKHGWLHKDQASLFGYEWYRQNQQTFDTEQPPQTLCN